MSGKRIKYDNGFKLTVIDYSKETNNCQAAKKFGVNEKLVRDWKKKESFLKSLPKNRFTTRGGISHWPELEDELYKWISEQHKSGIKLTRFDIRDQALVWAQSNPEHSENFIAGFSWCRRFIKRKGLALRKKNKPKVLPAKVNEEKINGTHETDESNDGWDSGDDHYIDFLNVEVILSESEGEYSCKQDDDNETKVEELDN